MCWWNAYDLFLIHGHNFFRYLQAFSAFFWLLAHSSTANLCNSFVGYMGSKDWGIRTTAICNVET